MAKPHPRRNNIISDSILLPEQTRAAVVGTPIAIQLTNAYQQLVFKFRHGRHHEARFWLLVFLETAQPSPNEALFLAAKPLKSS